MDFEANRDSSSLASLDEIVNVAINQLQKSKRFLLLVEAGRIDHAHHVGNAYRVLEDLHAFDRAIELAHDKVNIKKKTKDFKKFFIDEKLLKLAPKSIFLHCLPRGDEVSNNVFLGKKSHVWQQALNRVHVQKSNLMYCFNKLR